MKQLHYKNIDNYFKIKNLYIIFIYLLIFYLFKKWFIIWILSNMHLFIKNNNIVKFISQTLVNCCNCILKKFLISQWNILYKRKLLEVVKNYNNKYILKKQCVIFEILTFFINTNKKWNWYHINLINNHHNHVLSFILHLNILLII